MSETAKFAVTLVGGILLINALMWAVILFMVMKKYGPKPAALVSMETPGRAPHKPTSGYYLETQTPGGKRFLGWGLLARGNGTFYLGARGVYFLRTTTKNPIFIPFDAIGSVDVGPSGRVRTGNMPMLHIKWKWEKHELNSLICVSKKEDESRQWAEKIMKYTG